MAAEVEPDSFTATRGAATSVNVLDNDDLGDSTSLGPISVTLEMAPTFGTVTVEDADGDGPALPVIRVVTPAGVAPASLEFRYSVAAGGTELGSAPVTGTVVNAPPVATADAATVASMPGTTVTINVLANDTDPDGGTLTLASVGKPAHGRATIAGTSITYDPVDGYSGTDTFDYGIQDGQGGSASATVTVTVTDSTTPMVLTNDTFKAVAGKAIKLDVLANDVSGGRNPLTIVAVGRAKSGATITFTKTAVTYKAPKSFKGADTFAYSVRDGFGNEAKATVKVDVAAPPATVAISVSGPLTRASVRYSYRAGCPVRPASLRKMRMNYWDYKGKLKRGSLIVRKDAVADLTYVFTRAFESGFRIKKVYAIDVYYKKGKRSPTAADRAAMAAGNTSAFNCRAVVGNPTKRSAHSYGIAIDINTFENPYVVGNTFYPPKAGAYLKRTPCRTGMICPGGVVATSMKTRGWYWGARWAKPDYQHFSSTGG